MAERVYLHVGTPKSGTTYLQSVLWQNAEALKGHNVLLPGRSKTHYAAARGVTSRNDHQREVDLDIEQAWPRLAKQMRKWDGDALVSHELLAPASTEQASRAKRRLAAAEVHVVLTARTLSKQLSASWQEQVKRGLAIPFDLFLRRVREGVAIGEWFWDVQDLGAIAARWAGDLPPERVHIVTVPRTRDDRTLLWRRYSGVMGLDPAQYDSDPTRSNASLGPAESELLRLLHNMHDDRFTDGMRHQWTRKLLAGRILGQRSPAPFGLPDDTRSWVDERTASIEEAIRAQGYDVVGDLADLHWYSPPADARTTASVTTDELDDLMAWTIGRLQEALIEREPRTPPPPVGPDDGMVGIFDLLEHIRAADSGTTPRKRTVPYTSRSVRLRKSITALRGR